MSSYRGRGRGDTPVEKSISFGKRVAADEEQCTQIVRACQDNFVSGVHAASARGCRRVEGRNKSSASWSSRGTSEEESDPFLYKPHETVTSLQKPLCDS